MKYVLSLIVVVPSLWLACQGSNSPQSNAEIASAQPSLESSAALSDGAQDKTQEQEKPQPGLTSNQALMRDKLKHMSQILSGLTMDNFDQVAESGLTLAMISRATSWHIPEPTPKYQRLSKNFQEQAKDLERHALEKNIEAATLDLVRMNISCTECHQHMREHLGIGK
ncbi:MAG: hypothetical protein Q8M16_03335 [Pirellulaceae bacterium]|nr:hypothetical protein [Pirellulaceae bacterium]